LFSKVRWAQHCHPIDFAAINQFARYQASLDRFAYTDVVGNENTDRIKLETYQQGNQLVWPGINSYSPKRAKWSRA
jgi:hypothetical protein